jgi:hypothetical protein
MSPGLSGGMTRDGGVLIRVQGSQRVAFAPAAVPWHQSTHHGDVSAEVSRCTRTGATQWRPTGERVTESLHAAAALRLDVNGV